MNAFTEGLTLYRGVLTVIDQCKDLLFATETGKYLKASGALLRSTTARGGPECEHLRRMLENTPLTEETKALCLSATLSLQHIFNVQRLMPEPRGVVPVTLAWPVLISADFVGLLHALHPQALIIFAQYAVLLHRARNLWIFGDGGKFLIRSISELLGSKWGQYLESPLAALSETLPSTSQETLMDEG